MAVSLGLVFLDAGLLGIDTDLSGTENALSTLSVVAFLFALLVFASRVRLWRLVVYGVQLGLTALVASFFWLERGAYFGARTMIVLGVIAIGGELAALLAIVISRPRSSAQASDRA